jgi:hypothetical protein
MLEYGESMVLASVIEKALNEYEEGYDCHDKGSNQHLNTICDDEHGNSL